MKTFLLKFMRCTIAVILIGAATFVCYENSVDGAFIFDDNHFIVENDNIKHFRLENAGDLKQDVVNIAAYNPFRVLLSISFALNFKYAEKESFDDFSPYGFHVTNIAVHFLASVLAFFVIRKIIMIARRGRVAGWAAHYFPALIAAMLFTVCPLHTEAVTYVVQRGESMCAMFILAAMLFFLHARSFQIRRGDQREKRGGRGKKKPKKRSYAWLLAGIPLLVVVYKALVLLAVGMKISPSAVFIITGVLASIYLLVIILGIVLFPRRIDWGVDLLLLASFFFFGLAALTKELAAVLPLLLLLIEAAVFRAGRKGHVLRNIRYHAPFLITLALFFALRMLVMIPVRQSPAAAEWEGTKLNIAYLEQQVSGSVVLEYLGMTFVPMHLNLDPDIGLFGENPGDRHISTEFAGLILVIVGVILLHKYSRLAAFGFLWFFVALLPTSSILEFSDVMAEHRVYLPSLGIFMAVGIALTEAARLRRSRAVRTLVVALVAVFVAGVLVSDTVRVRERNKLYWNPAVIWMDTVNNSPEKARPYNALGFAYMKNGSPRHLIYLSERIDNVKGRLDSLQDRPGINPAAEKHQEWILQKNVKRLDAKLREQNRNLALAKMFFETAEVYDLKHLWDIFKGKPDPRGSAERFNRLEANRIYNNLGVIYSQESEGLKVERKYAPLLKSNETTLEKELMRGRLQALAYYKLSLMINPAGIRALVNSSKIRFGIADDYQTKAMAAPEAEQKKYWGFVENELNAAEFLVLQAMTINPNFRGAVIYMKQLEFRIAFYYDPYFTDNGHKDGKDARKALKHWRWLEWLSNIDPTIDKISVQQAIDRLESGLPD